MTLSHARQEELVPHLSAGRAQSRDNAGPQFGKPKIPSLPLNGLLHEPRQTLNLTWEHHSTNKEMEQPQAKFLEARGCGKVTRDVTGEGELGVGVTVQADTRSLDESKQTKFT